MYPHAVLSLRHSIECTGSGSSDLFGQRKPGDEPIEKLPVASQRQFAFCFGIGHPAAVAVGTNRALLGSGCFQLICRRQRHRGNAGLIRYPFGKSLERIGKVTRYLFMFAFVLV